MTNIYVRPMIEDDVPDAVEIINAIIEIGGTTAHEELYTVETFSAEYYHEPKFVNVALNGDDVVGFQAVFEVEPGVFSIGSFASSSPVARGAGRALTAATVADCQADGGTAILAKITEDNTGGLTFYGKMGFEDWKLIPNDHQRPDGSWVDRIVKRLVL